MDGLFLAFFHGERSELREKYELAREQNLAMKWQRLLSVASGVTESNRA